MTAESANALQVFLSCFVISSLGGLAALLRSGREIKTRDVISAMLYAGLVGLVIGLVWFQYFSGQDNVYFLIGVSGLAGLGGTTLLDFFVQIIAKGGVNVHISPKSDSPAPPQPPAEGLGNGQ